MLRRYTETRLPARYEVVGALDTLRDTVVHTRHEGENFDWAADAIEEYLSVEPDAWLKDEGYGGHTLLYAVVEELRFRLGEQLGGMVAELGPDERMKGLSDLRAAERILVRLPNVEN